VVEPIRDSDCADADDSAASDNAIDMIGAMYSSLRETRPYFGGEHGVSNVFLRFA
jgi:hypothetical protein